MKHSQRQRILYVEDDVDTREVVKLILAAAGYQMTTADTCAHAIDLTRADKFDLYLIDILLPDGSGFKLCEQLNKLDPTAPVIFCSGSATDEDKESAAQCGAQAYLVKPFDSDDLLAEISRVLDNG